MFALVHLKVGILHEDLVGEHGQEPAEVKVRPLFQEGSVVVPQGKHPVDLVDERHRCRIRLDFIIHFGPEL